VEGNNIHISLSRSVEGGNKIKIRKSLPMRVMGRLRNQVSIALLVSERSLADLEPDSRSRDGNRYATMESVRLGISHDGYR
jgi:hypothetical protein